jgi:hypothetical protein
MKLPMIVLASWAGAAYADPCGMVPPMWTQSIQNPITRVGAQKTYVFYEDGVESFVLRPAFSGKVDEFGMLISFPTPPAIRKVPEEIFDHITKAIDPPEVYIYTYDHRRRYRSMEMAPTAAKSAAMDEGLSYNTVRVIREEAVGMYEMAVLEAGSSAALQRWMEAHQYRYPNGMDAAVDDYVRLRWCFVAVKARVGRAAGVDAKPGMRSVDPKLPDGANFDGAVHAMEYRFQTDQLVVPMRLSAYNDGELRNVIYLLSRGRMKIRGQPEALVVRQVDGAQLRRNVTHPLPVRVIGPMEHLNKGQWDAVQGQRDPAIHNGYARDLFAADLLAVSKNRLVHPFEEKEKVYLRIAEELGLRGSEIDALNHAAVQVESDSDLRGILSAMDRLTMNVIDGVLDRDWLAKENIYFAEYKIDSKRNNAIAYDAKNLGPGYDQGGTVIHRYPKKKAPGVNWR